MFKARRIIAGVLVGWYLAALLGIPLPGIVEKDLTRPFPCQHHRCGCSNAADCWQRCCCFSFKEKLAWARAHGVSPPSGQSDMARQESGAKANCCSSRSASTSGRKSCCGTPAVTTRSDTETCQTAASDSLSAIDAMGCRGLATTWLLLSLAAPPLEPVCTALDLSSIAAAHLEDESPRGVVIILDPPPPEATSRPSAHSTSPPRQACA